MSGVTPIRGRSVVEALRSVLARAERGEIRAAVVAFETANSTGHCVSGENAPLVTLIGELHVAQMTLTIEAGRMYRKEDDR